MDGAIARGSLATDPSEPGSAGCSGLYRVFVPNRAAHGRMTLPAKQIPAEPLSVDDVGRGAFDGVKDFREEPDPGLGLVDQWGQDQVSMVGHDYRSVQVISETVVVEATGKDDFPSKIGKGPAVASAEGDEVALVVALRERAAVEHFQESFAGLRPVDGRGRPSPRGDVVNIEHGIGEWESTLGGTAVGSCGSSRARAGTPVSPATSIYSVYFDLLQRFRLERDAGFACGLLFPILPHPGFPAFSRGGVTAGEGEG